MHRRTVDVRRTIVSFTVAVLLAGMFQSVPALADHGGTPNVTVSPAMDLDRMGDVVRVEGLGFGSGAAVQLSQCRRENAESPPECRVVDDLTANADGAFTTRVFVDYTLWGSTTSCQVDCSLRALASPLEDSASLSFAAPGGLRGWGDNGSGQIGDGTTTTRHSPTPVSLSAVGVDGGAAFSVALQADGTVWNWGNGQYLVGGAGSTSPVEVTELGSDNRAVAAGGHFGMALKTDGTVRTWGGLNVAGELGNGTTTASSTPVTVQTAGGGTLSSVLAIAGGAHHGLALSQTGHVWAWGANNDGQVGNGAVGGNQLAAAEVLRDPETLLTDIVAIAAGQDHSLAVDATGRVWAWGDNDSGQLGYVGGDSPFAGQVHAASIESPTTFPLTNVQGVGAGFNHSLFLMGSGDVYAVGDNFAGQLGNGSTGGSSGAATQATGITTAVEIEGAGQNSMARLADASVQTWGSDAAGQLGNGSGSTTSSGTPQTVPGLTAVGLGAGNAHLFAIAGGGATDFANVSLTVNEASESTGITTAALEDIPAAQVPQELPATETAPIGRIPIGRIPIGRIPIGRIPIGRIDFETSPIGRIPIGRIPIGRIPIGRIPIGRIGTYPIGQATLAEFPIYREGGWPAILLKTANLQASTPQGTTFAQLMDDPNVRSGAVSELNPLSPDALRLDEFNFAFSPLANLSLLSVLLGDLTWDDITNPSAGGWCGEWTALGQSCAATPGTADRIFEADLNGFPLDRTTLGARTVGDVGSNLSKALFPSLTLYDVQIKGSALAKIELGAIPAANRDLVVDCSASGVDCGEGSTQKLGESPAYESIRPSATFGDLGSALNPIRLSDIALTFVERSALPWEEIPLAQVPFEEYTTGDGEPAHLVRYTLGFDVPCDSFAGLEAGVTLPDGFRYRPDSSAISEGGESVPSALADPTIDGRRLTWKPAVEDTPCTAVVGASRRLEIAFEAMTAFELGSYGAEGDVKTNTLPLTDADDSQAVVQVTDFEPSEGSTIATETDTLIVGQITGPDDIDNFTFAATPGRLLNVSLSHLSSDLDMVVYTPTGAQQQQALRSVDPVEIPFGKAPLADPGDALGGVLPPEVVQDIPLVPGRQVAGISSFRGTDPEFVSTVAVEGNGGNTTYRVQVSGYNGTFGPQPYVLLIRSTEPTSMPECTPRTFPNTGTAATGPLPAVSASDNTLFIVNQERLGAAYGTAAASSIAANVESLAHTGDPSLGVQGEVVYVDSAAAVQTAFTALDADPCSVDKTNAAVRAINDVVDGMKANALNDFSGIRNVVIVGDDDIVPHARLVDGTSDGNERGFLGDAFFESGGVLKSNQLTGAFGNGYFLSDAPFGAFTPLSLAGQIVYIPQAAVGRLPGGAATINAAIDRFELAGGVADPGSATRRALVTDYDFFTDGGQEITDELKAQLGTGNVTRLSGDWSRQQFVDAFTGTGTPPDVVSPNGHYDQYRMLPGEGDATSSESDLYTSDQLRADPASLELRIAFSIGCHFGLDFPNRLAGASPTALDAKRVDDWADVYADKGNAVMVGNLGYGFGDLATVAFSEELMANFSANLGTSPTVGRGLVDAERSYFSQMASFTPYDLKTLQQTVLWGLPMFRTPGSGGGASVASVTSTGTIAPDPISGLESTQIRFQPAFTKVTQPDGTAFYRADGGTQTTHGYPVVPKVTTPIPQGSSGLVAHGAAPLALQKAAGADEVITNTFANATLDSGEREPAVSSEAVYPTVLQSIGTTVGIDGSFDQELVVVPAQFRSDSDLTNDPAIGTIRRFVDSTWLITYSTDTTDFDSPDIELVEVTQFAGNTAIVVDVNDTAGIGRVFAQALMADGTYRRVELGEPGSADGNGRWTGGTAGTPLEVTVFAFDHNGNSSSASQKGPGYVPSPPPPDLPAGVVVTVNDSPPAATWYSGSPTVKVTPNDHQLSVDGGAPAAGQTTVTGDGLHRVDVLDPTGATVGTILVPVDNTAPEIVVVTPPAGTPHYGVNESVTEDYACIDSGSGVASCTDSNTGTELDTSRPGTYTFTANATDVSGKTAELSRPYVVDPYTFQGFFQPVDNVLTNRAKAGATIPVRWRITDSNGIGVSDPGSFVALGSIAVAGTECSGGVDTVEELAAGSSGLVYLGDGNWQYNWKTLKAYAGQCRTMSLKLYENGTPGGKVYKTANFTFK
jgi:alpha-tubulin suppressor-like RCC1 family protein